MDVLTLDPGQEVVVASRNGMSIRFKGEDVRPMGRLAYGVRAIRLKNNDEIVSIEAVSPGCYLFTVTEKGFGKRVRCEEYRHQTRGGTGVINISCGKKNGFVVGAKTVGKTGEIILVTDTGRTIRFNAQTVPRHKRGGTGVHLMDLNDGEKISGVGFIGEE